MKQSKILNYLDLFRYRSLRQKTIFICLVIFSIDFLYYGPVLLLDSFGFDFYLNGVILDFSEVITYFFGFFLITKIKRRLIGLVLFTISFICCASLIFLSHKSICVENCWDFKTVLELFVLFVFRFVVSFFFQILIIYINELYPT